jgi:hypothetical protein
VSDGDERRDDLLRRFEDAIAGAELDDLRQLAVDLSSLGAGMRQPPRPVRPELRRQRLREVRVFRVRVDLRGSKPPIWRRLELRSDLTLDSVHKVLQAAFGWTDTHLWRFSLGGGPFDHASQLFLCEWDVEEGEIDDERGVPATEVRLDETIQDPGDILSYAYDYGDGWELKLTLEDAQPAAADTAWAVALDGRRAAPPEDCGGITDGDGLAEILDDPGAFDLDAINEELRSPFMLLTEHGFDRRLSDLVWRLAQTPVGEDLSRRAAALIQDPGPPDERELRSLSAFTWFLDRAAQGGIPLTAAGYLKPVDVTAAAQVIPMMGDWIGAANRESETSPVLHFRQQLQSLGLLRKYKGALLLTRAGAAAQHAPEELWNLLADKLAPTSDGFETDATLLVLVYAATSANAPIPLDDVAASLTALGWRTGDRQPVEPRDLYWLRAFVTLTNVSSVPSSWRTGRRQITPAAARLARAALHRA